MPSQANEKRNLSIGAVAQRTGLSISAIRFYESAGLIAPKRNNGGQRRFLRSDIRRLSFILITQQLGFSLDHIRDCLKTLPKSRTPTQADWAKISVKLRGELDRRINLMTRMRERLDGCIGCGCLSLTNCALYNPDDKARNAGPGPRHIIDPPSV